MQYYSTALTLRLDEYRGHSEDYTYILVCIYNKKQKKRLERQKQIINTEAHPVFWCYLCIWTERRLWRSSWRPAGPAAQPGGCKLGRSWRPQTWGTVCILKQQLGSEHWNTEALLAVIDVFVHLSKNVIKYPRRGATIAWSKTVLRRPPDLLWACPSTNNILKASPWVWET